MRNTRRQSLYRPSTDIDSHSDSFASRHTFDAIAGASWAVDRIPKSTSKGLPIVCMSPRLDEIFGELGISQYLDAFVDQGFDTWETILDITESDL